MTICEAVWRGGVFGFANFLKVMFFVSFWYYSANTSLGNILSIASRISAMSCCFLSM